MNKSDIYASIVKDVAIRLKNLSLIDDYEYNDIVDDADNRNFADIFSGISNKDIFSSIISEISNWDSINENITTGTHFYIVDVAAENQHYFKDIGVYDDTSHFLCVTLDYIRKFRDDINGNELRLIERIWSSIVGEPSLRDQFWDFVRNGGNNRYIIITDTASISLEEKWRLYCFGYLLHCNYNSFPKPSQLTFDPSKPFQSSISLILSAKYEQYFDFYDLINESHFCDDVLSRYLNMYHILENMCYRRHLARISRGNVKRSGFVRKTISKFSARSDSEKTEIINGIKELFPSLTTLFSAADFNNSEKSFLKQEYDIQLSGAPSANQIALIIYQLRNSIAHNKATELHFAFENVNDYSAIIDLIKKFIDKLEPAIIDLLGNNPIPGSDHPLEYKGRSFEVY